MSAVSAVLQGLYETLTQQEQGFNAQLQYGVSATGDYYGIRSCQGSTVPESITDTFCKSAAQLGARYIGYVRNAAIYGNSSRRVYGIHAQRNGGFSSGLSFDLLPLRTVTGEQRPLGIETQAYDTLTRPWFVQTIGWTAPYRRTDGRYRHHTLSLSSPRALVL